MIRKDHDLAFMLKYENVAWYEIGQVKILDRRIYPTNIEYVTCKNHYEVARAITDMVTQSAGPYTAASMGMALAAYECHYMKYIDQIKYLEKAAYILSHARPTTINRMKIITSKCLDIANKALESGQKTDEAIFLHTLESMNRRYSKIEEVARNLVSMFPNKGNIMTQCFGETIVGMMLRVTRELKKEIKVFCPETRPYLQGSRLTASVCYDQGFDVTVITDNMPAFTMQTKNIDVFTSAADSICLDGNVVNKVGTLQIAISAHYFGVPYFVTGIPDEDLKSVSQIVIEERNPIEVLEFRGIKTTLDGVKGYYPAFDITPPKLISGVVTDKGIFSPFDLQRYYQNNKENFW